MLVGEVSILVTADTSELDAQISESGAFDDIAADAGVAGADAGTALSDGVRDSTAGLEADLGAVGLAGGTALHDGTVAGTEGLEDDLGAVGFAGGTALHDGAVDATEGLEDDLGRVGDDAGKALTDGVEKHTSGLGSLLGGLGVPESLLSGPALTAEGLGIAAAAAVDFAFKMQDADTAIATNAGISQKAAEAIGNAFLGTAGQSEFSGREIASAYASVAGQLTSTEGHALSTADALAVMTAAGNLATATGDNLTSVTQGLAGVMQAFQIPAKDAAGATDVLFNAAKATGQSTETLAGSLEKLKTKMGGLAPPLGDLGGLLLDLTNHGETGRAAMSALSSVETTLLKPTSDLVAAQQAVRDAISALPPSLRALATQYESGKVTSEQFETASEGLGGAQTQLVSNFTTAVSAVNTANLAQQKLGITVTNNKGQMLPLVDIIGQLHDKVAGLSPVNAAAELTAIGFGSAATKLVGIVQAGPAAFDQATAAVTKQGSAQHAAQEMAQTFHVELHTLIATFEDFATELGQSLIPIVQFFMRLLSGAIPIISTVVGVALKLLKWVIDFKPALILLSGVLLNMLLPALATMVGTMVGFVAGIPAAIAGMLGFGEAAEVAGEESTMAFGPIGLVIAAIGIAVYEVIDHWKQISAFFVALWHDVEHVFEDFIHDVMHIFDDVIDFVKDHWQLIVEIIGGPLVAAGLLIYHFRDDIKDVFIDIWHFIDDVWDDIRQDTSEIVDDIVDFFKKLPGDILHIVENGASDVVKAFEKYIPGGGLIGSALGGIAHLFGEGGIVTTPTLGIIGEKGPEAIIPLSKYAIAPHEANVNDLPTARTATTNGVGATNMTHGDLHIYIQQPNMNASQLEAELSWLYRTGQLTGVG